MKRQSGFFTPLIALMLPIFTVSMMTSCTTVPTTSASVSSGITSSKSESKSVSSTPSVSSGTSSASENSSVLEDWILPADSSRLNAEQLDIYNNIRNNMIKIYENRSYYLAVNTGYIQLLVRDSDDGLQNFNLMYSDMPAFDTNAAMTVSVAGKSFSIPKGEGEQFNGIVPYADFEKTTVLEIQYQDAGQTKTIQMTQSAMPGLSQEQVILLMAVDPQAKSRYYFEDPDEEYFYCIYPVFDETVPSKEYGRRLVWLIEFQNYDSSKIFSYTVSENPLYIR